MNNDNLNKLTKIIEYLITNIFIPHTFIIYKTDNFETSKW